MILLATGGRTFCESTEGKSRDDYMAERSALGFALDFIQPTGVIVGDANGADRWVGIWADKRGVPCEVFAADWSTGKRAGPERNQRMVNRRPDAAVRFPGGNGTADCARRCENAGIDVYEVSVK